MRECKDYEWLVLIKEIKGSGEKHLLNNLKLIFKGLNNVHQR